MIAYGWTLEDLQCAIDYANKVYRKASPRFPMLELRDTQIKSDQFQRGNQTIQFTLGFKRSRSKHNRKEYAPGIAYKWQLREYFLPRDIIPEEEFTGKRVVSRTYYSGRRRASKYTTRSTGICWHAFGHFMTYLFEINSDGKIQTGVNVYKNRQDYRCKAGHNKQDRYCNCSDYGLEYFFNIDDEEK